MTDEVYRAIAAASSGFVEAPAGCGKTEAIVKTVGTYCSDPQLILTHTHAGVDALRQRFKSFQVSTSRYHIDTIAGWAWGWVRKYPANSQYTGAIDIAEWNDVYGAMARLLEKDFVRQVVLNSYAGIIVDEYQDCTVPMHQLISQLKGILPCRILGDPLQGIFGFRAEQLVGWSDVEGEFANNLGVLETPHRWIKAENEPLGRWLLGARTAFRQNQEPDYRGAPIDRRMVAFRDLGAQLISLNHQKQGRICVIGPKARRLAAGIETTLVNKHYRVLEPNELSALRALIQGLSENSDSQKAQAAIRFFSDAYGGIESGDKSFIEKILKNKNQSPRRSDRKMLHEKHTNGTTPQLLLALIGYLANIGSVVCKLQESVSALKCILERNVDTNESIKSLYAEEIVRRKHQSRSNVFRCIGSTLLVKGLEFDHAIILRSQDWQRSWGNYKDLYVALTRGSRSVTLIDLH